MPYTVDFVQDANFVRVVFSEKATRADHEIARDEANRLLTANNCKNVLVDATRRKPGQMTTNEDFDFTSKLPSSLPRGIRIAVLVNADELGDRKFIEDVAQNRALNLRLFSNEDRALSWLGES